VVSTKLLSLHHRSAPQLAHVNIGQALAVLSPIVAEMVKAFWLTALHEAVRFAMGSYGVSSRVRYAQNWADSNGASLRTKAEVAEYDPQTTHPGRSGRDAFKHQWVIIAIGDLANLLVS